MEPFELQCPCCGEWLEEDDAVYVREDGVPVGCSCCLHEEYAWQWAGEGGEEDDTEKDS